jgi:tRNA-dihydrouridine synthase
VHFELAPLEGVTTWIYRSAYHRHFSPADRYFTPFIAPNMNKGLNTRERNDVLPEHNTGLSLVPQILTNRADYFLTTCADLQELGYTEVNLNLGCPSGTVVAKGKGSGFLSNPEGLEQFLDEIFAKSPLKISIKTRIGRYEDEEWERLLALYCRYPLTELIVHPRVQKDFYKNTPRVEAFRQALETAPFPVVYNGDLFTPDDISNFANRFPTADTVMIGRGILCNPWLLGGTPDMAVLKDFHDEMFEGYREVLFGDGPVLCKMKGIWTYLIQSFTNYRPYQKTIRKTRKLSEYQSTVNALFHNEEFVANTRWSAEG